MGCLEKFGERTIFLKFWKILNFGKVSVSKRKLVQWVEFQKGAHTLRLKRTLARDSNSFFWGVSSQQPKKTCQNSVWYFQFFNQLFGSLRTCIPFVWALAFTVSPFHHHRPSIRGNRHQEKTGCVRCWLRSCKDDSSDD